MTLQVHIAPGHDIGYPWKGQAEGGTGGWRTAGDAQAAAHYERLDARFQEGMQAANRAALEHLGRWAVTRTGYHGARIDGQEPGKYERAGLVVTSWLQGTSRDGDPHDHVHNAI